VRKEEHHTQDRETRLLPLSLDSCNSLNSSNSSNSFFDPFSIRAHTQIVSADITFRKQTRAHYETLPPGSPRFQLIDDEKNPLIILQ
jgi:hypothetical protein